jgi:hypothetical protein
MGPAVRTAGPEWMGVNKQLDLGNCPPTAMAGVVQVVA